MFVFCKHFKTDLCIFQAFTLFNLKIFIVPFINLKQHLHHLVITGINILPQYFTNRS